MTVQEEDEGAVEEKHGYRVIEETQDKDGVDTIGSACEEEEDIGREMEGLERGEGRRYKRRKMRSEGGREGGREGGKGRKGGRVGGREDRGRGGKRGGREGETRETGP